MGQIKKYFAFLFFLSFGSCKKVIDIKVKDSDTKYVIEGIITNEPGSCKVYLSKTNPFNQENNFPKVSGADIKIADNGSEITLTESAPGV